MIDILVEDGLIDLKFDTMADLTASLNQEIITLNAYNALIGIDGKPTQATSTFGNRQFIMNYFIEAIQSYMNANPKSMSVKELYKTLCISKTYHEKTLLEMLEDFNELLKEYDEVFEKFKCAVLKYKHPNNDYDNPEKLSKLKGCIYNLIIALYDILFDAKEFALDFEPQANILLTSNLLLKYLEVGSEIYKDPSLFTYEHNPQDLFDEIAKRHTIIKACRHSDSIMKMPIQ